MFERRELTHSLPWLHGKLQLDGDVNLYYLIGDLRNGCHEKYYNKWSRKGRLIHEPKGSLKLVQQRISELLLSKFPVPEASYGFSGGSCLQATQCHLGFGSILMLDLRDAFSQVTHNNVFQSLYGRDPIKPYLLSQYVARMVADLCTYGASVWMSDFVESLGGFLPQGPSSSPRLFDLALSSLDDVLLKWARYRNFRYTRYADNLFFSSRNPEFSSRTRAIILSEVGKRFRYHKLRQIDHGQMCKMLGLNLTPGFVCNSREFKRSFRGALHHLEFVLNHDLDYNEAWAVVKGFWGFSVRETIPEALAEKFSSLKKQIHTEQYGW